MKDIPVSPRIEQIKRNRRAKRLRLIILFFILFVSIVGAASYFSSNSKIVISNIVVTGNSIIDESKVISSIKDKLSGRYLRLFSRSNFLIYPQNKIFKSLLIEFPRIEELSIKREGFNTLRISVKERAGSYLYCGINIPEKKEDIGENCYFVNNDGYIFDKAPYFSGDVYFKYYMSIEGDSSNPLGSQMIDTEKFHNLVRFMDKVTLLGFKTSYLVVSSDGIYSLCLKSSIEGTLPRVIFKDDNDLNTIMDNFSTAMGEKEFANEINSKYDTLLYIDLRFKNKVLYKFQ